jgi:large subunit ribosomal protein L22
MEVIAMQKFIHTTPRKLRLVADMARKLDPDRALVTLRFTKKAAAKDISDVISTALANAKEKGMSEVVFKSIEVNEGPKMRRMRAGAKGRAKRYKKRMAHIKIVLTDEIQIKSKQMEVKNEAKIVEVEEPKVEMENTEAKEPTVKTKRAPRKVAK